MVPSHFIAMEDDVREEDDVIEEVEEDANEGEKNMSKLVENTVQNGTLKIPLFPATLEKDGRNEGSVSNNNKTLQDNSTSNLPSIARQLNNVTGTKKFRLNSVRLLGVD